MSSIVEAVCRGSSPPRLTIARRAYCYGVGLVVAACLVIGCDEDDPCENVHCDAPRTCVAYYGIGGPNAGLIASCEIRCADDPNGCPANRVLLLGRFYPGKIFVNGFFVGIGGGVEWLHAKKNGFDAIPQRECPNNPGPAPIDCPIRTYTLEPVHVNQFLEPQAILRISVGEEGAIGPVLCGGELALDIPTGDEPDDKSVVSLRARIAYRF